MIYSSLIHTFSQNWKSFSSLIMYLVTVLNSSTRDVTRLFFTGYHSRRAGNLNILHLVLTLEKKDIKYLHGYNFRPKEVYNFSSAFRIHLLLHFRKLTDALNWVALRLAALSRRVHTLFQFHACILIWKHRFLDRPRSNIETDQANLAAA